MMTSRNHVLDKEPNGTLTGRCFIRYTPPPLCNESGLYPLGAKEDWLERVEYLISDLTWLLELDQQMFWYNIINKLEAMTAIVSFLQEGTPYYMLDAVHYEDDMWQTFQKTRFIIFLIFNRLTTCEESSTEFISLDTMGHNLYDNYLITVPIMLDLCLMYGQDNRAAVSRIINTVFQVQPNYTEDLIKAIPFFKKVLRNVEHSFISQDNISVNGELVKLSDRSGERKEMTLMVLRDMVIHILDTAATLSIFLDVYQPACNVVHDQLFEISIVHFYENVIPEMYRKVEMLANTNSTQGIYADLRHKIDMARVDMLKIFKYIVSSIINGVLEKTSTVSETEMKNVMEDYLSVLTESLSAKIFIRDYHTAYPVDVELDLLSQLCPDMDFMKCDYLLEAVLACFETPPVRKPKRPVVSATQSTTAQQASNKMACTTNGTVAKKNVVGVELESLITEVKDILPHLGDGFIQSCLEHFDFASDAVINAVLEDTLPPALSAIDFSMPRSLTQSTREDELANSVQRLNVFDNDEFDIMTRDDVDTSRIHIGKRKGQHKNLKELIDDKTHRSEFRDLYTKFGLVDTEGSMYDDEYDDTYDHVDVSVGEAGEQDRRPFVVPRVLRAMDKASSSEAESEGDEGGAAGGPSYDRQHNPASRAGPREFVPFAQNPEEMRERAEQRRQAMRGHRRGSGSGPAPPRDVTGAPKGHGQEKNVTVNRSNKTKRGNPNRRAGAAHKRNMGMIPS